MSDLRLFEFDGRPVRTLPAAEDRPELFAAVDLAAVLAYSDAVQAVDDHVEDQDRFKIDLRSVVVPGRADSVSRSIRYAGPGHGAQSLTMVSEVGAWDLIMESEAPNARAVRKWLAREVLPALRARGAYALPDVNARLVATLLASQIERVLTGESDLRHVEAALLTDGPAEPEERERKLREVVAQDATRRMVAAELERWSAALPAGTPVPMPESVLALYEHLRVTRKRGGRSLPALPAEVVSVRDYEIGR